MRPISKNFQTALGTSQKRVTKIVAYPPTSSPVELKFISGSVTADISRRARYQASLQLSPSLGQNLFDTISTPGTIFDIDHGIDFGASTELVDVFYGEIVSGSADIFTGVININLADMWTRVDRCRFLQTYVPPSGSTRGQLAKDVLLGAVPGSTVSMTAEGGVFDTDATFKDRTSFIDTIEKDSGLDIAFEPNGSIRIRTKPVLSPESSSVWVFQSGPNSNLKTVERTRPFDRLYNTVVVQPANANSFFDAQTVTISDETHPRHWTKIGYVPFFYKSPTIDSDAGALEAAKNKLQDILGLTETASLGALSNPALEPGDIVTIIHQPTASDPGFVATHFIDSWDLDLDSGDMNLNTRSSTTVLEEEVI